MTLEWYMSCSGNGPGLIMKVYGCMHMGWSAQPIAPEVGKGQTARKVWLAAGKIRSRDVFDV
ncbi:hypothetical protein PLEOSDRAFT_1090995 [Pleurotus ostreatus PC15]|uniref:Uncharacterized protein n=1 Tax=Pleurotus ostreatus (strain PC15) TaxID=1137138 RepID=A0A067NEN3_PLEO1|nr:hypothetical protein PLEOSDRAFT_1090995 [Pleurotus ostreatus PC15]